MPLTQNHNQTFIIICIKQQLKSSVKLKTLKGFLVDFRSPPPPPLKFPFLQSFQKRIHFVILKLSNSFIPCGNLCQPLLHVICHCHSNASWHTFWHAAQAKLYRILCFCIFLEQHGRISTFQCHNHFGVISINSRYYRTFWRSKNQI